MAFRHDKPARSGVLLVNLGTPDEPTATAVRRYLRQFLSDPRVIDLPRAVWLPILYAFVLTFRPRPVAANYRKVWLDEGSPLLVHSRHIADGVADRLHQRGLDIPVELAMCYGQPSIAAALGRLRQQNVRRLLLLPLYPQYSGTTTAAAVDALTATLGRQRWLPELRVVNDYFDHAGYIEALAASVQVHQREHGQPELLLFSFHGLPERYWHDGDPYPCQCQATARLVAERLKLGQDQYRVTFQSRFGKAKWIEPYTDQTLAALPARGVKNLQIICPGFAADCLETLEEIELQNRQIFMDAGGERFSYIPALNDGPAHVDALAELISEHAAGWPEFSPGFDPQQQQAAAGASAARARAAGAPQ